MNIRGAWISRGRRLRTHTGTVYRIAIWRTALTGSDCWKRCG